MILGKKSVIINAMKSKNESLVITMKNANNY